MFEIGPTTVVQALNFIILLFILSRFLWKPLTAIIEERQRQIAESIKTAEELKQEAETMKAQYRGMLESADREAQKKVAEASSYAEKLKEQILAEAREGAARIVKLAEQDVALEKQKALSEVRAHVANLAVLTAGQVLKDALEPSHHERLMQDVARRVEEHHAH